MSRVEEILNFWFGCSDEPSYGKRREIWFKVDPAFDEAVRSHFLADYQLAASGQLDDWKTTPQSCLALILLLDQFPRHLFRKQPQAFATDSQALLVAKYAVSQAFDQLLLTVQRWFIYLPFEHSEDLTHQRQAVELFQQLSEDWESREAIASAIQHFDIIQRFGRFPHRNAILGRLTTPEEAEFLQQLGSSF